MIGRFHAAAPDFPPAEYENVFTNARGERLVIAWRSAPVLDDAGKVVRIVAGGLDITQLKQQEEELRASRARIVAAGDEERRRLERNLHDGAQQRLVALSLALRLAQAKVADDPAARRASCSTARARSSPRRSRSCASSRAASTRRCSPTAACARRSKASRRGRRCRSSSSLPDERLPEPIEAAAYYVVAEAVTNVVKHAGASAVDVRVAAIDGTRRGRGRRRRRRRRRPERRLGPARPGRPARRARRRLGVESPPSGGTRVVAEIPLPARASRCRSRLPPARAGAA